jgi:hypothetical protein
MTEIEILPWRELPLIAPNDVHFCGGLQVLSDGRAILYLNDDTAGDPGGFCNNPEILKDYAADAVAAFAKGDRGGWHRLTDGSYTTALMTPEEAYAGGRFPHEAPPRAE